jgi:hypothetical protein
VNVTVHIEPAEDIPSAVEYRWDADTAILTAGLADTSLARGVSGSVELAGSDGSWVILDVRGGRIQGVEVAVWPDVKKLPTLRVPGEVSRGRLIVPSDDATGGVALMQMETTLVAESDQSERTIHFRLGTGRHVRTVCIAHDILVDLDESDAIGGIWLLNVPPFPGDA